MQVVYSNDLREYTNEQLMCTLSDSITTKYANQVEPTFDDFIQALTPAKKKFAETIIELFKRNMKQRKEVKTIRCSQDIYDMMHPHLFGLKVEECWAIFMNNSSKPIKVMKFTRGGLSATLVDKRVIAREAIQCNACSMALIHNHPSDNNRPSMDDDNITKAMKEVCSICNIRMLDHVIFCDNSHYSFADEGRL